MSEPETMDTTLCLELIAVVDFGGQFAHLIANRVRRLGVFTEIVSPQTDISWFEQRKSVLKGIIFSGGPSSVYAENAPSFNSQILRVDVPILGICYGLQIIVHQLGKCPNEWLTFELLFVVHCR